MTTMKPDQKIPSVGWSSDRHIRIVWRETPEPERMLSAAAAVRLAAAEQIADVVHAYRVITVTVSDDVIADAELADEILRRVQNAVHNGDAQQHNAIATPRSFNIPVVYTGPDLSDVAKHCGCSVDEVVRRHTAPEYVVRFLGFMPGFAYLDNMDKKLATPRLATPRRSVPAGGVGIGGEQTGVYPRESPGGWRIIGQTTLVLFDPINMPEGLLRPGDKVRFTDMQSPATTRGGAA